MHVTTCRGIQYGFLVKFHIELEISISPIKWGPAQPVGRAALWQPVHAKKVCRRKYVGILYRHKCCVTATNALFWLSRANFDSGEAGVFRPMHISNWNSLRYEFEICTLIMVDILNLQPAYVLKCAVSEITSSRRRCNVDFSWRSNAHHVWWLMTVWCLLTSVICKSNFVAWACHQQATAIFYIFFINNIHKQSWYFGLSPTRRRESFYQALSNDGVSRHVSCLETVWMHGFSCPGLCSVSILVCLVLAHVSSFHVSSCSTFHDCVLTVIWQAWQSIYSLLNSAVSRWK